MTSFDLSADTDAGALLCRIFAPVSGQEMPRLAADLHEMIEAARGAWGPVRLLLDDRAGHAMATLSMRLLGERLRAAIAPGDRIAVLLPPAIGTVAGPGQAVAGTRLFIDEEAAMAWLGRCDETCVDAA